MAVSQQGSCLGAECQTPRLVPGHCVSVREGHLMATGSGVLEGDVVLVTGAGRGIGLGIASAMADAGAKVAMVSRSADQLDEASRGVPGSLALPFDV